jgi:hypothetical protein
MAELIFYLEREERMMLRLVMQKAALKGDHKMVWDGNFLHGQWLDLIQGMDSTLESKKELIQNLKKEKPGSSPLIADSRSIIKALEESLSELSRMWGEVRDAVGQRLREQAQAVVEGIARSMYKSYF